MIGQIGIFLGFIMAKRLSDPSGEVRLIVMDPHPISLHYQQNSQRYFSRITLLKARRFPFPFMFTIGANSFTQFIF